MTISLCKVTNHEPRVIIPEVNCRSTANRLGQVLYRLCQFLGADFEQAMHTLQAGGQEAGEILNYINIPTTAPMRK